MMVHAPSLLYEVPQTKFAESAVKMGVAFDVSAEEVGQSMAEMRDMLKRTDLEIDEFWELCVTF